SRLERRLSNDQAERRPPEVEVALLEPVVEVSGEIAEIAHVNTCTDVIGEESHRARTQVPSPVVVVGFHAAHLEMRANESEAAGYVGPDPAAVRSANRHAHDQVAHQIELVIAADVCVISEEIRVEAEARFATDDTRAHAAGVHTESTARVRGEPATKVDAG